MTMRTYFHFMSLKFHQNYLQKSCLEIIKKFFCFEKTKKVFQIFSEQQLQVRFGHEILGSYND